ncbi:E3 ubiquitin-protein ligase RNF25 [Epinephelus fuscoguttatus]|uniref:E3 ubiquitin-protein ligase RNF25 n=1 Tax=Epinephelus fuscoguttatus TaxID=293821 RepID=UPI0020D04F7F|nr:E3 ubiquitin-protein ligase RNF25 [Epinephelus fuscoguttatus]XP_049925776.1 E3 ubiquitin-protein ligase RNF25 [Epinephelus moara]
MAAECDVLSEIEVLESIYLDELQVNRKEDGGWDVSLVLYPSTAEDSVSQFVRLTLTLTLDQQYPSSSPAISIHNPRGLSDDKISSVQKCLQLEAQSCLGSPVLYQLIEKAKEILTESNIPHGNCVICLYGFKEGETFSKTNCYHYFHSHCLGRYASHSEMELRQREKELEEDKTRERTDYQELTVVCPVCREPLSYSLDQLLSSPAPQLPEMDEAAIGSTFQQKWCELQKLLERQRSKGGIIDPEVESNRFFIHTNETPSAAENGNLDADVSPGPPVPSASNVSSYETGVRADQFVPGLSHCRGGQGQKRQNQMRGPRRGGRSKPQHRRAAPITEHLDKLSLSSDCTERPIKAKAQGNHGQQVQVNAELCQSKTGRGVHAEQQETLVSPDDQPMCQAALETECPKDAADSGGGRGHHGRRRGPHRSVPDNGALGPARYHWDGRASRSRGGGPNNLYSRGGGPRRGHGRGFQHKVVERERGREEVL